MMGRHRHVPQESLIESFGFFLLLTLATPTLTLPLQGEGTKLPAMPGAITRSLPSIFPPPFRGEG